MEKCEGWSRKSLKVRCQKLDKISYRNTTFLAVQHEFQSHFCSASHVVSLKRLAGIPERAFAAQASQPADSKQRLAGLSLARGVS